MAATLLTGCAATTSSTDLLPTSKPAATATETSAATVWKTGDLVTDADVQTILKAGNGQRAYPMSDGTFIVVTRTAPLPAAVQVDADAKAAAVIASWPDASAEGAVEAYKEATGSFASSTGKRVIVVWDVVGYPSTASESKSTFWTITGEAASGGNVFVTRGEAQVAVDTFLSGRDNVAEYAVISAD